MGNKKYFVNRATTASCNSHLIHFLKLAGFTETVELENLPPFDSVTFTDLKY